MNLYGKAALFAGGVLFGSAGLKLLASKDAKKVYTHTLAAALRVKESAMGTVTAVATAPQTAVSIRPCSPTMEAASATGLETPKVVIRFWICSIL